MELVNTAQEFSFFFLNWDMVLVYSTPDNFATILQIKKLNKIDKFETVWIHL